MFALASEATGYRLKAKGHNRKNRKTAKPQKPQTIRRQFLYRFCRRCVFLGLFASKLPRIRFKSPTKISKSPTEIFKTPTNFLVNSALCTKALYPIDS